MKKLNQNNQQRSPVSEMNYWQRKYNQAWRRINFLLDQYEKKRM